MQYNALGQPLSWSWAFDKPSGPLPAQRLYNTAGQLTSSEFATFAPESTGGTLFAANSGHGNTPAS